MNRGEASWLGLLEHARSLEPDPDLAHLSDVDLQREVRDGASRLAALECGWLLLIGELVVRGVWADEGARTPGQWLSFTCSMDGSTAREKVRVALALRELPEIRARFAAGTLSYSKVRALTRVASPEIEDELVRWEDGPPQDPAGEVRDLRRLVLEGGAVEYRIRVGSDEAMAIDERLDRLVDLADRAERADRAEGAAVSEEVQLPPDDVAGDGAAGGGGGRRSRGARRAAALVDALAVAVAAGVPDRSGTDDHLVVVHVAAEDLVAAVTDPDGEDEAGDFGAASADAARHRPRRGYVTTGRSRGMMLPRGVLARLACDADLRVAGASEVGHPADIGRRSRKVPADLENLALLCGHHHRFVHDRGWSMRPVAGRPGRWTFHAPGSDRPLEAVRAMPGASADALAEAHGAAPPPLALQPPWWDGGPYDVDETIRIISEMLLDVAA